MHRVIEAVTLVLARPRLSAVLRPHPHGLLQRINVYSSKMGGVLLLAGAGEGVWGFHRIETAFT